MRNQGLKKSNAKSIRLSDPVMQMVMDWEGEGFNNKLEAIILFAAENRAELEEQQRVLIQQNDELENSIIERRGQLWQLTNVKEQFEKAEKALNEMIKRNSTSEILKSIMEDD